MKEQVITKLFKECSEIITEKTQEIHQFILGSGDYDSEIMFLLDAPGAKEEATNQPIAAKTESKFLECLEYISLRKEDVYITNLVKYRPYRINAKTGRILSRSLKKEEISYFIPYLEKEINIIKPRVIVTLGMNALHAIIGETIDLERVHGQKRELEILGKKYIIFPMYHPMAMGYENDGTNDFEKLLTLLNEIKKIPVIEEEVVINEQVVEETAVSDDEQMVEETAINDDEQMVEETAVNDDEQMVEETAANNHEQVVKEVAIEDKEVALKIKGDLNSQIKETEQLDRVYQDETKEKYGFKSMFHQYSEETIKSNGDKQEIIADTTIKEVQSQIQQMEKEKYVRMIKEGSDFREGAKLKTLLVYGGSKKIDDPTNEAISCVGRVLKELNASIIKYDLNDKDVNINDFFSELKYANSVVLATTVEWYGIGGLMQQFLDECWKFANKSYFKDVYLMGIVISRQSYERDAYHHMIKSWELLGGLEGNYICASMESSTALDTNLDLIHSIEKKTEAFYRLALANKLPLPTSIRNNRKLVEVPQIVEVIDKSNRAGYDLEEAIPKSTLKNVKNYDEFMEKQQQDIEDISNMFKQKLQKKSYDDLKTEPEIIKERYKQNTAKNDCVIQWEISNKSNKNTVIEIKGSKIKTYFGLVQKNDLLLVSDYNTLKKIIEGKVTIQRAFMTGSLKAKGDFGLIYQLDGMFDFAV